MLDAWPELWKGFIASFLIGILLSMAGCSGSGGSGHSSSAGAEQNTLSLSLPALFSTVSTIDVNVAFEPGAEPFTGTIQDNTQIWSILQNNIDALFLGRTIQPAVNVPMSLPEMSEIPDQKRDSWTTDQVLQLAASEFNLPQTPSTAEFFVLFLNGNFSSNGTVNPNVVGISIEGTPVIAVFKNVILSSGMSQFLDTFIEQATLVHEFGHNVGLVNDGLPMVTNHEDPAHPHHCTNQDCVMFWENDTTNLVFFIQVVVNSNSDILFGPECLEDARSYRP